MLHLCCASKIWHILQNAHWFLVCSVPFNRTKQMEMHTNLLQKLSCTANNVSFIASKAALIDRCCVCVSVGAAPLAISLHPVAMVKIAFSLHPLLRSCCYETALLCSMWQSLHGGKHGSLLHTVWTRPNNKCHSPQGQEWDYYCCWCLFCDLSVSPTGQSAQKCWCL